MPKNSSLIEMVGKSFGRFTVLARAGSGQDRGARWLCRCACGTEKTVAGTLLRRGIVLSCGCWASDRARAMNLKHGAAHRYAATREYQTWRSLKARCENPHNRAYRHYGGRGISVCEDWSMSFEAFLKDMGARPFSGASIERVDNSKGYGPDNCVWADRKAQARNKRSNVGVVRGDGAVFATMVEAAEATGVHPTGVRAAAYGKQRTSGGFTWTLATLLAVQATGAK